MTFYHLLIELAARTVRVRSAMEGIFSHAHAATVTRSQVLSAPEVAEFEEHHSLGELFQAGRGAFNTFVTGPFGYSFTDSADVEPGGLRFVQPHLHLIFSRSSKPGQLGAVVPHVEEGVMNDDCVVVPRQYRYQDPRLVLIRAGLAAREIPALLRHESAALRELQRAGAEAAIDHAFSMAASGQRWVTPECERAFRGTLQTAYTY